MGSDSQNQAFLGDVPEKDNIIYDLRCSLLPTSTGLDHRGSRVRFPAGGWKLSSPQRPERL